MPVQAAKYRRLARAAAAAVRRGRPSAYVDPTPRHPGRLMPRLLLAAVTAVMLATGAARAQGITVMPVSITMLAGQMATSVTVTNHNSGEASFQVRPFAWTQHNGQDQLVPADNLLVSPPIATIPPGQSQIMRLVLRKPPQHQESTWRILIDQIPAPAQPGTVQIALRLSIPIFAEPAARIGPDVRWHVENDHGQVWLVGVNRGAEHDLIRNIVLETAGGQTLKVAENAPPYILPGATHRWRILNAGPALPAGTTLRMTATGLHGPIRQSLRVTSVQ